MLWLVSFFFFSFSGYASQHNLSAAPKRLGPGITLASTLEGNLLKTAVAFHYNVTESFTP